MPNVNFVASYAKKNGQERYWSRDHDLELKIKKIGKGKKPKYKIDHQINAKNNYLSSGFIDLHIHGQIDKISTQQARSGTTGFLFGLHAGDFKNFAKKIKLTSKVKLKAAKCLGYHLEGPFINKAMAGAQPKKHIQAPNIRAIKSLFSQVPGLIKIITFAIRQIKQ